MAAPVRPPAPVRLPDGPTTLTREQKYWQSFSDQLLLGPSQHSSPVTHISFPPPQSANASLSSPAAPEAFAVTSGARVQIFSTRTRKLLKTISRFNVDDIAHSGNIRRDGRVLVAGGDSGIIQAFDANSRAILKTWKEHKQPVWVTNWHPTELTSLMSCSDDRTVRLWDLASETSSATFTGHQDYVRCGAFLPGRLGLIASGSYDQTVQLWDARVGGHAVMIFKHAAAVEAVLPMPSGTALLAASGNRISVLDVVAGKPSQVLSNHQKTVTSLALAAQGTRVLSGGLDGHVKVFESNAWNVVAGLKYSSPVLSVNVISSGTQDDKHLVVGMQSGVLSIKTRLSGQQKVQARQREKEMQALMEGRIEDYDKGQKRKKGRDRRTRGKDFTGEGAGIIIEGDARGKLRAHPPWATALRRGQYDKALDLVLQSTGSNHEEEQLTLLTALWHRSALRSALSDRDEVTLQPVLRWLIRNVARPPLVRITTDVALVVLDLYAEQLGKSPDIDALVDSLRVRVNTSVEASHLAWSIQGMVNMLMASVA